LARPRFQYANNPKTTGGTQIVKKRKKDIRKSYISKLYNEG
jgi:hypothetical protein